MLTWEPVWATGLYLYTMMRLQRLLFPRGNATVLNLSGLQADAQDHDERRIAEPCHALTMAHCNLVEQTQSVLPVDDKCGRF